MRRNSGRIARSSHLSLLVSDTRIQKLRRRGTRDTPRTLRAEVRTDRVFADLATAQAELDAWVEEYNTRRPHSSIGMVPPLERFACRQEPARVPYTVTGQDRTGDEWVARRAGSNGVISVSWQQICLGKAAAGHNVDLHITDRVLQVWGVCCTDR